MKTVNKLDLIYRKLVVKAQEQSNETVEISDEDYDKYYLSEYIPEPLPDSDIPIPGEEPKPIDPTEPEQEETYDYSGCDFGIDQWGYNIISMEDNKVSIKYCGNKEKLTEVIIPKTVEYNGKVFNIITIKSASFYDCVNLTSITIHNSITSIERCTFNNCQNLTSIIIENNNPKYDSRNNCNAIIETATNRLIRGCKNTIIPNSIIVISEDAFNGCIGLTNVTIPNSVTTIETDAFSECISLTNVTIPNSVTKIKQNAFRNCPNLIKITLNSNSIIKYDYSLTSQGISNNNLHTIFGSQVKKYILGNSITSIGTAAFGGCTSLTSITIPDSVTSIGEYSFYNCSGLTNIIIPDSVISIGKCTFEGCTGLTNIIIPDSVTSIEDRIFFNCSNLKSIIIGNSVTSIGEYSFYNCSGLTNIISYSSQLFSPNKFINNQNTIISLYVLDKLLEEYTNIYEKEIFLNKIKIFPISELPVDVLNE